MGDFMVQYRSNNLIKETAAVIATPRGPTPETEILMQTHVTPSPDPDQITEQWLPIAGYEGIYEVSSFGRVRSLDRKDAIGRPRHGRFLSPGMSNGYLFVQLSKDKGHQVFRVHSLVAAAFLGERPKGYTVNHIDGAKTNNRFENLEYLTMGDNVRHWWKLQGFDTSSLTEETKKQYTDDDLAFIRGRLMGP